MSLDSSLQQQLHDWTSGLREGSLSPAAFLQLEELLTTNETARRHYIELMSQHASLRRLAIQSEQSASLPAVLRDAKPERLSFKSVILSATPQIALSHSWVALGLVAIVFYGCFALLVWNLRRDGVRQIAGVNEGVDPSALATIESSSLAEGRLNGAVDWHPGDQLNQGDSLDLDSGVVRLAFADGASLALEGPAQFTVEEVGRTRLQQGRLKALVPPSAVGFTVATPHNTVVDLGTEFGLEVDQNGNSDVHVFDGRVEVHSQQSVITLQANQGKRFHGEMQQPIRVDARKFAALQTGGPITAPKLTDYELRIDMGADGEMHWSMPEAWGGKPPHIRGNYHVGRTSPQVLRSAKDANVQPFPGILTIHRFGKLACKNPGLVKFHHVILDGGSLLLAGNDSNSKQDLGGAFIVESDSLLDLCSRDSDFFWQLSGSGDLTVLGPGVLRLLGTGNGYAGNWRIRNGSLAALTIGSLGTGSVLVEPQGRFEVHYEWQTEGVVSLAEKAVMAVSRNVSVGGITIEGQAVRPGHYTVDALSRDYPGHFNFRDGTETIDVSSNRKN